MQAGYAIVVADVFMSVCGVVPHINNMCVANVQRTSHHGQETRPGADFEDQRIRFNHLSRLEHFD